ncbi:unnamed protein product [Musa textilis]
MDLYNSSFASFLFLARLLHQSTAEVRGDRELAEGEGEEQGMAEAHLTLLLLAASMSCLVTASQAHQKIHIVGGSYGWKIPPNTTFYEEWANKQSFFVGDKLGSLISKKTKKEEMNDQSLFPARFLLFSLSVLRDYVDWRWGWQCSCTRRGCRT